MLALPESGAWSDYVLVHEDYVFKLDDDVTFVYAVALGVHYIFASDLVLMAKLEPTEKVLILAAHGTMVS